MKIITDIVLQIWQVYLDVSLYMLFGFLIAALLHAIFKPNKIKQYLGKGRIKPVLLATFFGIPIPLCSCGVIPVVTGLKREGANDGAALAFMIATPESGVDSIAVSWAMLDPVMTIMRPIAGIITAICTGFAENFWGSSSYSDNSGNSNHSGVAKQATQPVLILNNANNTGKAASSCSCCSCSSHNTPTDSSLAARLRQGMRFAFEDLLMDIAKPFTIGVIIAGIITFFFPANVSSWSAEYPLLSMLIMLVAGIPMYVCATASTPIAAALILKGVAPGAVLVFLLAGPATNAATIAVVKNIFNRRALAIYLGMIAICSMGMGVIVDAIYSTLDIKASAIVGQGAELIPHSAALAAALLLGALLLRNVWKKRQGKASSCCC